MSLDDVETELKRVLVENEKLKAKIKKQEEQIAKLETDLKDIEEGLPPLRTAAAKYEDLSQRYQVLSRELQQRATSDRVRQEIELEHQNEYVTVPLSLSSVGAQKTGWLMLHGAKRSWKKRFFALKDAYLFVYKSDKPTETRAKFLKLNGCHVIVKDDLKDFHFIVESPLRDTKGQARYAYELRAADKAAYEEWLKAINIAIAEAAPTRVGLTGARAGDAAGFDKQLVEANLETETPGREEFKYNIGDRVLVRGYGEATVRWFGYVATKLGMWIGVEFDEKVGKNDGCYDGKRYFHAKSGHGLFTRQAAVEKLVADGRRKDVGVAHACETL